MHPFVLNCKIRDKQITILHNFVLYSYNYMFQPHRVIIRLAFRHIYFFEYVLKASLIMTLWD
jgi:hypothetical protein